MKKASAYLKGWVIIKQRLHIHIQGLVTNENIWNGQNGQISTCAVLGECSNYYWFVQQILWGRMCVNTDGADYSLTQIKSRKSGLIAVRWRAVNLKAVGRKKKKTHLPPSFLYLHRVASWLIFSASSSTLKLHVTQHYFKITNTTQLAKNDQQSSEIHIHMFCVKKHQGCDIVSNSVRKYVHVIFFSKIKLAK